MSNLLPKGRSITARYIEQLLPDYQGNPLIESLPAIMSEEEFIRSATYLPEFDPSLRQLPKEIRLHAIMKVAECRVVLLRQIELEQKISRAIRMGYKNRNPLDPEFWKRVDRITEDMQNENMQNSESSATSGSNMLGFDVIGISGGGKTTAVEMNLNLYPQIIEHNEYEGRRMMFRQVSWLKLDCPFDGSIKGLCHHFFRELDTILGTKYFHNYVKSDATSANAMVPSVARVCWINGIGVLVIDEVQNLSVAKSGGAETMLNFFVNLCNIAQMPVVLIGTPKAIKVIHKDFRLARRSSAQGNTQWNTMNYDSEWHYFLETIWEYQYVKKPIHLTDELSQIFYFESAGIPFVAIHLFVFAQARAINSGAEEINSEIILSVVRDNLGSIQPMLAALRSGDVRKLEKYDDLNMSYLDNEVNKYTTTSNRYSIDEIRSSVKQSRVKESTPEVTTKSDKIAKSQSKFNVGDDTNLLALLEKARKHAVSPYEALLQAGHIKNSSEFLN
jgi:hypothetical protein